MGEIKIIQANEKMISDIAYVFAEAFKDESINKYIYDFSREDTKERLQRSISMEARLSMESQEQIIAAVKGDKVVGFALLKKSIRESILRKFNKTFKRLYYALPLLARMNFLRIWQARKAFTPSQKISQPYLTLAGLAVHPEHQGQGIGKMLLKEVELISERDQAIDGVYLYTGDLKNKLLYELSGYELMEERQGGELTVYHMFKDKRSRINVECIN